MNDRLEELILRGIDGLDGSPGDSLCYWAKCEIMRLRAELSTADTQVRQEASRARTAELERDAALKDAEEVREMLAGSRHAAFDLSAISREESLRREALGSAISQALETNGGPVEAKDTVDGIDYVLVTRAAFDALTETQV